MQMRPIVPPLAGLAGLALAGLAGLAAARAPAQPAVSDTHRGWAAYGGGPEQIRYSSLTQITRRNVARLEVAWTYDSGEAGDLQTQPVVVNGLLYAYTPGQTVLALDAATGRVAWTFDAKLQGRGPIRGVMRWGGSAPDAGRIFAPVHEYVYALDEKTGAPIATFGDNGRIDLRLDLGRPPDGQSVRLTTPGVVYQDLLIVGGRVNEGLPGSPGHIRAYDVRTGKLRWIFHTIPHPGEFGHETWSKESWTVNGGANSWPGMALDERRGIVYIPTGSASADFYGANRVGDNLFANSLLALDAATGKRLWHFQIVRHDILDRDPPSPPNLVTVRRDGRMVDAVAQTTKHGVVFLFEREKGTPLFPIEQRAVPASDVPGEQAAATQPMPTAPRPFARQVLTRDMLTTRTPEAHAWALQEFQTFQSGGGPFAPLRLGQQTVVFPGFDGGAEWGGQAFDPQTGLLYVNSNDIAWTGALAPDDAGQSGKSLYLRDCATCHRDDRQGTPPQIPALVGLGGRKTPAEIAAVIQKGAGRMPGFPSLQPVAVNAIVGYLTTGEDTPTEAPVVSPTYVKYRFTGYRKFLDPDGYPAVAPPWGTLNAIDLNTGEYAWTIPFGEYPELAEKGLKATGSENYGGPIVTAGGLVFIGATNHDRKFRAFDKATGALLWETTLPFSGNATPATYDVDGRQFVVIAASGGKSRGPKGGVYVAFALPRGER
jgi:quinoprotein glucose dehydrogenase